MNSNLFFVSLFIVFCTFVVRSEGHQVRLGFNFQHAIPTTCVARPAAPNATAPPTPTPPPGTYDCVKELTGVMKQQMNLLISTQLNVWRQLHRSCSPNAPFALFLYEFLSTMYQTMLTGRFVCVQDIAYLLFGTQQGYLNALTTLDPTLRLGTNTTTIPNPWIHYLDYTQTGIDSVTEDLNLGFNVYFSYQFAVTTYPNILTIKPYPFKDDYDKIANELLRSRAGLVASIRTFYDPNYTPRQNEQDILSGYIQSAWNDGAKMREQLEPTRSLNEAQTIARSDALKVTTPRPPTTGDRVSFCQRNPNPSQETVDSFLPSKKK